MSKERVVCAMSGGVDSSVAAALLLEQGFEVIGLFMRNGIKPSENAARGKQGCCSLDDALDARRVADRLGIPFYAVNLGEDFGRLIEHFMDEYDRGRTPNPCIRCNRHLKFGRLLETADELGATRVATGHYARLARVGERLTVARGLDPAKDQSYVLFPLDQRQLSRTLLPLGELEKSNVRERARDLGFGVADKPDSQEICFVPDNDYGALIRRRRPGALRPGPIVDREGRVMGEHEGHQLFTIGQRRGFGRGFGKPVYVIEIDAERNTVVVGDDDDLFARGLVLREPHWLGAGAIAAGESLVGTAKVRHRHDAVPARAYRQGDGAVAFIFDEPVRAVTPGQGAVLYDAEGRLLVGGFVDEVLPIEDGTSSK